MSHPVSCLRESSERVMGRQLFSIQTFICDAVYWLSAKGLVEVEACRDGDGPIDGYSVRVTPGDPETIGCVSFGETLGEALCGALRAFDEFNDTEQPPIPPPAPSPVS